MSSIQASLKQLFEALSVDAKFQAKLMEWRSLAGEAENADALKVEIKEGYVGLNFFARWDPGVFVGVILDGGDHAVRYSEPNHGPDLVVKLSFAKRWHGHYEAKDEYKKLVVRLSGLEGEEPPLNGWTFYDRLNDPEMPEKPNLWHPLYLRRPLSLMLYGSSTIQEQLVCIRDPLIAAVEAFLQGDYITALRLQGPADT